MEEHCTFFQSLARPDFESAQVEKEIVVDLFQLTNKVRLLLLAACMEQGSIADVLHLVIRQPSEVGGLLVRAIVHGLWSW